MKRKEPDDRPPSSNSSKRARVSNESQSLSLSTPLIFLIPEYTNQEFSEILQIEFQIDRITYFRFPLRAERHQYVRVVMHTLYQLGSRIINSGLAYTEELSIAVARNFTFQELQRLPESSVRSEELLKRYVDIPEDFYDTECSNGFSKNVLRTLFILKVALDQLPVDFIYDCYNKIQEIVKAMSFGKRALEFPNGGRLIDDSASGWIFSAYLFHNQTRFQAMELNITELQAAVNYSVFVLGHNNSGAAQNIFTLDLASVVAELGLDLFDQEAVESEEDQEASTSYEPVFESEDEEDEDLFKFMR